MIEKIIKEINMENFVEKTHLLDVLVEENGEEVYKIVDDVVKSNMLKYWSELAKKMDKNSIDTLVDVLWNDYGKTDGFEFTIDKSSKGTSIKCTKCTLAEWPLNKRQFEWGYRLYCASDIHIVNGFNDKIGFERSLTLMEGDQLCNHFYYYKDSK